MSFGVVPDGLIYAYFGSISGASTLSQAGIGPKVAFNGSLAATVDATLTFGTLVGTLPGSGFVLPVAFAADGSFSGSVSVLTSPGSPAGGMLNFSGVLAGRILTGSISGVASGSFAAVVDPAAGSSTGIAGFYSGPALGSASGSTYLVVGTQGDLLALAVAPTLVTGALGSVGVNNTFVVTLPGPATISGTVNPATTVVTSTLTTTSGTTVFASLAERTLPTGRLSNLSSLGTVSAANNLAAGFVIGGSGQASLLLRGIGPGLNPFGITDFLTQPQLQLYDGAGQVLAANSSWGGTAAMAAAFSLAGAFPLAADSLDAAVLKGLAAGSYTIQLGGAGAAVAGTALAEIYDAGGMPPADGPSLINLSARALVTPGSGGLTGGFVIAGNSPLKLLIRGVGPELSVFGVSAPLPDPALMVFDRSGSVVARNDDWATPIAVDGMQVPATAADLVSAAAATGAFPLAPGSKDAAVIVTLAPGLYSAQVTGGPASGVALVEIYAISP